MTENIEPSTEGLRRLFDTRLPLNRKEVYFTATVLPAIICADEFRYFGRFLKLLGAPEIPIKADPSCTNIQFFTEYSLAEAIRGKGTAGGLVKPTSREIPDLIILIDDLKPLLIAIEAKMYDATGKADLISQLRRQDQQILSHLRNQWPDLRIIHAALMPAAMKQEFGSLEGGPIVTWEEIQTEYADVASAVYFVGVLRIALEAYEQLRGNRLAFGEHAEDHLSGGDILRRYQQGLTEFQIMGRQGGIDGPKLRADVATGKWKTQKYEVRRSPDFVAENWFLIANFIDLILGKTFVLALNPV
jgi:hypothetical protein